MLLLYQQVSKIASIEKYLTVFEISYIEEKYPGIQWNETENKQTVEVDDKGMPVLVYKEEANGKYYQTTAGEYVVATNLYSDYECDSNGKAIKYNEAYQEDASGEYVLVSENTYVLEADLTAGEVSIDGKKYAKVYVVADDGIYYKKVGVEEYVDVTTVTPETDYVCDENNMPIRYNRVVSLIESSKDVPIENAISKYFTELENETWTLSTYRSYIRSFAEDDIYLAMNAYCNMTRYFENKKVPGSKPECIAEEYADYIIKRLDFDCEVQNKKKYENVKASYIEKYKDTCIVDIDEEMMFNYAKRISLATAEEIEAYIYLPRLKRLNISENLIESIDDIAKLSKLAELYAGDNELVDISKVDWASMSDRLRILDLSLNDISNIEPLEVLEKLEYLDLSKNLIEGEFTFKVEKLEKLKYLDLSYNRLDDIQRLINYLAYEARFHGYDGDIAAYLRTGDLTVNFKYQQLEITVDDVLPVGDTARIELPKIFRQIEEIDYANTSFGIDSVRGNVTSDGKEAIVDTRTEGKHVAVVTIINTKTKASFGYGTTCEITYRVGTANSIEVIVTPEKATVEKGKTQEFTAEVKGDNVPYTGVTWSISGNTSDGTTISETGLLTVAEDETSENIEVIATSFYDTTAVGKVTVAIIEKAVDPVDPVCSGFTSKVFSLAWTLRPSSRAKTLRAEAMRRRGLRTSAKRLWARARICFAKSPRAWRTSRSNL